MTPTDEIEKGNFRHLVLDIFWFGLALPATSRFMSVFALRVGADAFEIGLLTSLPALILLFSAMLSQWWHRYYPDASAAAVLPSLGFRLSYLFPAFTPLFPLRWQPLWLVASLTIPALAQGVSSVIFTMLMREAISKTQQTALISRRFLALNISVGFSTFALGYWLAMAPFPMNYQAMYVLAFLLTLISLWHVKQTRSVYVTPKIPTQVLSMSAFKDRDFKPVLSAALISHLAFFFVFPFVPVYLVDSLGADEKFMGFFVLIELLAGSAITLIMPRLATRFNHRTLVAISMVGTALSTLSIVLAPTLPLTLIGAALNGGAWTITGVSLYGLFTENVSDQRITTYTTNYNQVIFFAMFLAPMISSRIIGSQTNVMPLLIIGVVVRMLSAVLIGGDVVRKWMHAPGLTLRRADR